MGTNARLSRTESARLGFATRLITEFVFGAELPVVAFFAVLPVAVAGRAGTLVVRFAAHRASTRRHDAGAAAQKLRPSAARAARSGRRASPRAAVRPSAAARASGPTRRRTRAAALPVARPRRTSGS